MAATLKSRPRAAALLFGAALAGLATTAAEAHFQLLYTPEAALNESAAIELALVFSHPFDNGYTMDMGKPEAFYVVSQRGEGEPKTTDLMQYLEPIEWSGVETKAAAFLARPPRTVTRSLGDYTFVLRPAPYYEEQEDKYIQQITKTVVNVGGIAGRVGRSRSGCPSRSCRSTSRTRIGSAACSAPSCSRTASRCRTPRSRSSS